MKNVVPILVVVLFFTAGTFYPSENESKLKCEKNYCLGADDVIRIDVYREDELNRQVRILPDGTFSYPLLGKIETKGKTVPELETLIVERLKKYLINPQVTVFVVDFATVTVTGQVKNPGSFPVKAGLTVVEAIGVAGGFTDIAAQNDVKVLRKEDGQDNIYVVRVADIGVSGEMSEDIMLRRGDVVYVPESTVTVTGQVKKPDKYPLRAGMTVIEAISVAGGFTKIAARNKVKILRLENDKKKTIIVNVAAVEKRGDKSRDEILEPGDVIFVPESLF